MVIFSEAGISVAEATDMAPKPLFDKPELYFSATLTRPPHKTVTTALSSFYRETDPPGFAIDLGCGNGRDTVAILDAGWTVLAIDSEPLAIEYLLPRLTAVQSAKIRTQVERLETVVLPQCQLVNAGLVLPFCRPEFFETIWQRIVGALDSGGRFSGHLFGDRDSWARHPLQSHHTKPAVIALFHDFDIELLDEIEDDDPAIDGEVKHWHVFHIVARKR